VLPLGVLFIKDLKLPNMAIATVSKVNETRKIRIVLADDHPLMRQAIRMWLEKQQDLEVLAEACDGKEAVDVTTKLHPDIVIMDISMPKINGLEATRQIMSSCPDTNILVLTVHTDSEHIQGMIKAGASGYLTKDASGEDVVHAVRAVASGENLISSKILQDTAKDSLNNISPAALNKLNELTLRELFILRMVARGLHNKDIALKLGISLRGVKANLTTIFIKLGADSRTEAISIGLKSGILTIGDLNS
jgi:two-component system, NarL family, response regulator LiaR